MSNNATFIENGTMPDRRGIRVRMKAAICNKDDNLCQRIFSPFGYALIVILIAAAGLAVYIATGFYASVNSTIGHIAICGGIIVYFILMFGHGASRGRS